MSAPSVWSSKVRDVAKREAISLSPDASVMDAAKQMYSNGVGSVVVTSPEGNVIGIFTERDLARVVSQGLSYATRIGDVMTKNPVTISEDETLSKAVEIMSLHKIRHLPVVDKDGKLVGIITARDVVDITERYLVTLSASE